MESLGQDNVRRLSVTLLIDLLYAGAGSGTRRRRSPQDLEALAEDLLLSGAYDDTLRVTQALAERTRTPGRQSAGTPAGMRSISWRVDGHARDGRTSSATSTRRLAGDSCRHRRRRHRDHRSAEACLMAEEPTLTSQRAEEVIRRLRQRVRFATGLARERPALVRAAQRAPGCSGASGRRKRSPLLQPLLRQSDPRVVREAVSALGAIDDPAAARAIHTVLRAATGGAAARRHRRAGRRAATRASCRCSSTSWTKASRSGRITRWCWRRRRRSELSGSDDGVAALGTLAGRRAFLGRKKLRAVKEHSRRGARAHRQPESRCRLEEAARTGDRMLRKIAWIRKRLRT